MGNSMGNQREFYDIYQQAEWVVCDSTILYYASKFLKKKLPDVIPGSKVVLVQAFSILGRKNSALRKIITSVCTRCL